MEKIKSYIIAGLVLFLIIFFSVHSCDQQTIKAEDHTKELKEAIANEKKHSIQFQNEGEALKEKIKQDTLKTWKSLQALKHENKELRKRIAPVRIELQLVIDSMAIVREFVGLTDSLDVIQEATINMLSAEKVRIWRSFNTLLTNKDEQIKIQTDLNNHFDQLNQQLSKDVKRERLKKTGWKIAAGVLGGALISKSIGVF